MKKVTLARLEALETRAAIGSGRLLLTGGAPLVRGEPRYLERIAAGEVETVDSRGWTYLGDAQVVAMDESSPWDLPAA